MGVLVGVQLDLQIGTKTGTNAVYRILNRFFQRPSLLGLFKYELFFPRIHLPFVPRTGSPSHSAILRYILNIAIALFDCHSGKVVAANDFLCGNQQMVLQYSTS